jgi:hypothetical protein
MESESCFFKSKFTLNFKNPFIEENYLTSVRKNQRIKNIIYSSIIFMVSIINNLIYSIFKIEESPKFHQYIRITSYVITGIYFTFLLIGIFTIHKKAQQWISYLNYFFLIFVNYSLRSYLYYFSHTDVIVVSLVYSTQHMFRFTWYLTGILDFIDGFYLGILITIVQYAYFSPFVDLSLHIRFVENFVSIMLVCLISYYYILDKRQLFYYFNRYKKNLEWHDSILENMNSGFLSYSTKDNRLNYINKEMSSIIHRNMQECISLTTRESQDERIEINDKKSVDIRILPQ